MDEKHSSCEVYEDKKFSCGECHWKFTSKEMLAQHMKRSHGKREFKLFAVHSPDLDKLMMPMQIENLPFE